MEDSEGVTNPSSVSHIKLDVMFSDTETDMLRGEPLSASCVQGSDDSRNSAIRIAYRTLLRSSSLWEPRYPSLKIFLVYYLYGFGISKENNKGSI